MSTQKTPFKSTCHTLMAMAIMAIDYWEIDYIDNCSSDRPQRWETTTEKGFKMTLKMDVMSAAGH